MWTSPTKKWGFVSHWLADHCQQELAIGKCFIAIANVVILTLYPLRLEAVFLESANKDTLPVYIISFESHWPAYLGINISNCEGGSHFKRNSFKMQKWMTSNRIRTGAEKPGKSWKKLTGPGKFWKSVKLN